MAALHFTMRRHDCVICIAVLLRLHSRLYLLVQSFESFTMFCNLFVVLVVSWVIVLTGQGSITTLGV